MDINLRFVDACENGDYPTVIKILDAIKDFNVDVKDKLGRTALRLSVENEHLEVKMFICSQFLFLLLKNYTLDCRGFNR
jgi:hypothetical protein